MALKKIECPLMEKEIDDGICFDIHMNVEGLHLTGQSQMRY